MTIYYMVGDIVEHREYGIGTVISIDYDFLHPYYHNKIRFKNPLRNKEPWEKNTSTDYIGYSTLTGLKLVKREDKQCSHCGKYAFLDRSMCGQWWCKECLKGE